MPVCLHLCMHPSMMSYRIWLVRLGMLITIGPAGRGQARRDVVLPRHPRGWNRPDCTLCAVRRFPARCRATSSEDDVGHHCHGHRWQRKHVERSDNPHRRSSAEYYYAAICQVSRGWEYCAVIRAGGNHLLFRLQGCFLRRARRQIERNRRYMEGECESWGRRLHHRHDDHHARREICASSNGTERFGIALTRVRGPYCLDLISLLYFSGRANAHRNHGCQTFQTRTRR